MKTASCDLLRGSKASHGTWLSIGSPVIAELAADCGFDWLLFDLEHGCGTEASLLHNLQAVRGARAAAIVRVGAPHHDLIARVLDLGADGIMVPHIESADEARACVQAMRYPPRGHRGFSRSTRAFAYGLDAPSDPARIREPVFVAQVETLAGVRAAEAIAATDGVDMLFVGPADLGFDLRVRPSPDAPSYEDCLRRVAEAARGAGKAAGILVRDQADLPHLGSLGFSHFGIDSDIAILRRNYQQLLAGFALKPEVTG